MFLRRLQKLSPTTINFSLALLVFGLGIVFTVVWGPNIKYTHTYYNLSQAVSAYAKPVGFFEIYLNLALVFILLLTSAISGRRFFAKWTKTSSIFSAIAAAVVILFGLFLVIEIESTGAGVSSLWLDPKDNLVISSSSPNQSGATYYIYFDKSGPRKIHIGQTSQIEITFKLLDHEVSGAYPIALDPNHIYAVGVSTTSIAFDIASVGSTQNKPTTITVNSPTKWTFLVSPKTGYEGEQTLIFEALIYDQTNNSQPVQNSPYASIQLNVVTPFGMPNWLVSSQTGIGAIAGGVITIAATWGFNELSELIKKRREAAAKKKEEAAKIWRPD